MKRSRRLAGESRGLLDDALIATATLAAAYSGGQAVGSDAVSYAAMAAILVGTLVSGAVARLFAGRRWLVADGFLYAAVGFAAYFGAGTLNTVFPEETFPRELLPSSWLLWLMALGSFALWRESTLLFQAIPPLALFGFVGAYDTFRPVVFFFFLYLVCAATLFARANARDMTARAEASGYFGPDLPTLRREGSVVARLREGPWRWAAGPNLALVSAGGIVLLSLLGGPVLRQAAKPISGAARLPTSHNRRFGPPATSSANVSGNSTAIARGPIKLRNTPAFETNVTDQRYYRTEFFDLYASGVWMKSSAGGAARYGANRPEATRSYVTPDGESYIGWSDEPERLPIGTPPPATVRRMELLYRVSGNALPVPGQRAMRFGEDPSFTSRPPTYPAGYRRSVDFVPPGVPGDDARPGRYRPDVTGRDLALAREGTAPELTRWALERAGKGSLAERAERLRAAIAATIRYNINASAAPVGTDPVVRALFETREGYCDVYATAMTLGARALGIPSRYAVGYYGDPKSVTPDGKQIILESDAHAWGELYFAGIGWVPYDGTAGAAVVPGGGRREGPGAGEGIGLAGIGAVLGGLGVVLVAVGVAAVFWPRSRGEAAKRRRIEEATVRFARAVSLARGRIRRADETLAEHVAAADLPNQAPAAWPIAESLLTSLEETLYGGRAADPDAIEREVRRFRRALPPRRGGR